METEAGAEVSMPKARLPELNWLQELVAESSSMLLTCHLYWVALVSPLAEVVLVQVETQKDAAAWVGASENKSVLVAIST